MLGNKASAQNIEDLVFGLMYMPAAELAKMRRRLATTTHSRRSESTKKR
jgi:hypothetical protein